MMGEGQAPSEHSCGCGDLASRRLGGHLLLLSEPPAVGYLSQGQGTLVCMQNAGTMAILGNVVKLPYIQLMGYCAAV